MAETWTKTTRKDDVKKENVTKTMKIVTWRDKVVTDKGTRKRTKIPLEEKVMLSLFHVDFGLIFMLL